jgi:hypothetical protein
MRTSFFVPSALVTGVPSALFTRSSTARPPSLRWTSVVDAGSTKVLSNPASDCGL